ncbi:NAD-dependent epimerase/dehydratase family protein [Pigmentibacter ruber]
MLNKFYENKSIVITGVAGFIGSHLAEYFLGSGIKVIGIDNLSLGTKKNISSFSGNENFKFINSDIVDSLDSILEEIKNENIFEIWHLAANSDIFNGVKNPEIDLKNTFMTTYNMLKLAYIMKIENFIFASTSAVYGDKGNTEIVEDIGPLFPISNYGAMKLASEASISAAVESYLSNAWIFRFPNVVGSRATHGIIYDFIGKMKKNSEFLEVLGDGNQQKQYLHVSELIDAMLFVRKNTKDRINYFNLGVSDSSTNVKGIAEKFLELINSKASIKYTGGKKGWIGDVPKFKFSTKKLNSLGWKPMLTSDQAVEKAIKEIIIEMEEHK